MEYYTKTGLDLSVKTSDVREYKRRDSVDSSAPSTSPLREEKNQLFQPQMDLSFHHRQRQEYVISRPSYIPPQIAQISPSEGRTHMITPPSDLESPKTLRHDSLFDQRNLNRPPMHPSVPISVPMPFVPVPQVNAVDPPLIMPQIVFPTGHLFNSGEESFNDFQNRLIENMRKSNKGTNPKMRRTKSPSSAPSSTVEEKTPAYLEKRRKNNAAAKRSRDNRRAKEDEITMRAAYFEMQNQRLQYELLIWKNEAARLQCIIRDH